LTGTKIARYDVQGRVTRIVLEQEQCWTSQTNSTNKQGDKIKFQTTGVREQSNEAE